MKDIDDAKTNLAKYSEIMLCFFLWGNDDDNHDLMNDIDDDDDEEDDDDDDDDDGDGDGGGDDGDEDDDGDGDDDDYSATRSRPSPASTSLMPSRQYSEERSICVVHNWF